MIGKWFWGVNSLKEDTEFYHQYQATKEFNKTLPEEIRYPNYQSPDGVVWSSKPINTQQITKQLAEYHASKDLELNLDDINFDELIIQETLAESSERASFTKKEDPQAQIEIPPKNN